MTEEWPDPTLLRALGRVVDSASFSEMTLRGAFCALLDSKYAAVVAGGQHAGWLIDNCEAIVKAHRVIKADDRDELLRRLASCRELNRRRNRYVHDTWVLSSDGSAPAHLQSRAQRYTLAEHTTTVQEIEATASEIRSECARLHLALVRALPVDQTSLEAQLRWEDHLASMSMQEITDMIHRRSNTEGHGACQLRAADRKAVCVKVQASRPCTATL